MVELKFLNRHIGIEQEDLTPIFDQIGISSIDQLMDETLPDKIRLKGNLNISTALSEFDYLTQLRTIAQKNQVLRSFIGLGYYNTITPSVIQRNILENPGWYTAYTPYQSEISQGRLEALINFQTAVIDLTGMELANASLLDEATAAAEAMIMLYNLRSRASVKNNVSKFFVSKNCFPQTIELLKTRSSPLGIELTIADSSSFAFSEEYFGALLQYPDANGEIQNYLEFAETAKENNIKLTVVADLLSLTLLKPPGEWGADVVVGTTQRFGVPLGFGGPHAAYFATKEEYKRSVPGRIIGASQDIKGNLAYRMALQTREQHIKRDKATSNICTSQVLLAVMAGMYAVYHGPAGLKSIANEVFAKASKLNNGLIELGYNQLNEYFFDTLRIKLKSEKESENIRNNALALGMNFRYLDDCQIGISVDETTKHEDIQDILAVFNENKEVQIPEVKSSNIHPELHRTSSFMNHPVFSSYHSETEMMRYLKTLENKDLSLTHSMIPLGSCTMKLNAASELLPLTWPEFASIHPYAPKDQVAGYMELIAELEAMLCAITGFDAVSLQPNSGAQGEYAGLMVIKAYQESLGQPQRNIVLIPSSAHGTNPASAIMAGLKVVIVKCDDNGNINIENLKEKAEEYGNELCGLMVTYPSTHGVFEEGIIEINKIIHKNGGQVYMDGANLNAQIGLTNPAIIGADVCHLNLHKTFAIPHGGGGPGMGPIAVGAHLAPFLPGHSQVEVGGENAIHSISQGPWGSSLILLISFGYIKMLGDKGIIEATKYAILNANYIKEKLEPHYPILYKGKNNRVAHEMIVDCRRFKKTAEIEVEDIAKRLIDYGFHAPTVSFPVAGTLMIEPTESESLREMDRFCDAMINIRKEIEEVEIGIYDQKDNVLKNAPHSSHEITSDNWEHSYPRSKAGFPIGFGNAFKYWPPVCRVDNAYGDRNLICACPLPESYVENSQPS